MAKFNIVHRCYNCGEILQSEDKAAKGYIDGKLLDEATPSTVLFCEKCFEEQKYNFVPAIPNVSNDYLEMLKDAEASDAFIVYVVDLFSFETSFHPDVSKILRNNPFLIIANKRDLMPEGSDDEYLKQYVAHRFRVGEIKAQASDVRLVSLTSGSDVDAIGKEIDEKRAGHDVYIIGAKGAGKTLFLSSLLKTYKNQSRRNITTSTYSGTQIKVMQIPLDSSSYIFDTPGTSTESTILSKLSSGAVMEMTQFTPLKKRSKVLTNGSHLMIGGLVRIDLLSEEVTKLKCYFPRCVTVEKFSEKQINNLFKDINEDSGLYPISSQVKDVNNFDIFDLEIEETGSRDIGISGLGWINFQGNNQHFRIYVPKGVALYTSRAKVE